MESDNKIFKKAKQKDNGKYATLGMMYECASYFNLDIYSDKVSEIVETYVEAINYCTFFEWIRSKEVQKYIEQNRW